MDVSRVWFQELRKKGRIRSGLVACGLPAILCILTIFSTMQADLSMAQENDPIKILALGDSLTAGYGLPVGKAYPDIIEKLFAEDGYNVTMINAGVSGDTTAGGAARVEWALADNPDAAVVELGANDALQGLSPEQAKKNLDTILTKLKEQDIPILLAGMYAPPNMGDEYSRRFNSMYEELAEKHDTMLYPFFLKGIADKPGLTQGDGLHPNAEGTRIIAENIYPSIKKLADKVREK